MRIGLIDIGSNTTKILVADCFTGPKIKEIAQSTFPCRLISPIKDEKQIKEQNIENLLTSINSLKSFAESYQTDLILAVATEGLRRACNSTQIVEKVSSVFGIELSILTGEQEAEGIARGLITDPNLSHYDDFFALDIGGGSLEIIRVIKRQVKAVRSLPVGAVLMAQQFLQDANMPYSAKEIELIKDFVNSKLEQLGELFEQRIPVLVGCGGNLVYLRKLLTGESNNPQITKDQIGNIRKVLTELDISTRVRKFPKLPSDRADIFPAGLLSVECVMEYLGSSQIIHSYSNLRHGLISNYAEKGRFF